MNLLSFVFDSVVEFCSSGFFYAVFPFLFAFAVVICTVKVVFLVVRFN